MKARLQKVIADSGHCSRRKAEALISEGRVTVNVAIAALGDSADPAVDTVRIDGVPINAEEKAYFLLNKPRGYECTMRSTTGKPLAVSLVKTHLRVFPVGRLDADSRGLLIVTNDGDFANRIIHPSSSVEKEYLVKVDGEVPGAAVNRLEAGVKLGGRLTRPCKVDVVGMGGNETTLRFVLHEGRKRQIRRMLESTGFSVADLKRIRMGFLTLDGVREGDFRALTRQEVGRLMVLASHPDSGAQP